MIYCNIFEHISECVVIQTYYVLRMYYVKQSIKSGLNTMILIFSKCYGKLLYSNYKWDLIIYCMQYIMLFFVMNVAK